VAPSRMVSVSASVNLPLHHKVQKFCSGTGSPRWLQKMGCKFKTVVVPATIVVRHSILGSHFLRWDELRCIQPHAL